MLDGIKAVIFDLDGTLVDSMWMWRDLDIDFLKEREIPYEDNIQEKIEGMSFTETALYFKEFFHLKESVEELKDIWNYMAMEKYRNEVPLKSGVQGFIDHLKSRGVKMGIATSNSIELVDAVAKVHNLYDYIPVVVTSCSVQKGKPAPDVYLEAARQLEVDPSQCLVFEDVVNGILAGINAGMRVCGIYDDYSKEHDMKKRSLCHYYIHSYDEVPR